MGRVFQAHDPHLHRQIAIKVLSRELSEDDEFLARFDREARLIARLEHPHIVPLYDYGHDNETGRPFLVMRLMRGGTLLDRINTLTQDQLLTFVDEIGGALEAAHKFGVIHRDIKPSNVLYDESGHAYLSDFGLARRGENDTHLTDGRIIGTPHYMSPEQYTRQYPVTPASDQYSFAILLFTLIAGAPPFQGETADVMQMHVEMEPDLSLISKPGVSITAQAAIRRAMSKNPDERFPSMQHFLDIYLHGRTAYTTPSGEGGFDQADTAIPKGDMPLEMLDTIPDNGQPRRKSSRSLEPPATSHDINFPTSARKRSGRLEADWLDRPVTLNRKAVVIGRTRECALNLAQHAKSNVVSRRHAMIVQRNLSFFIQDLSSTNGTFHNGRRIEIGKRIKLANGDTIIIGEGGPELKFVYK